MPQVNLKSKLDWYIISKARELRLENNLTQEFVAVHLGKSLGFIGSVESPKTKSKYNIQHINALAKLFKCSLKDFFPDKPF